MINLRRIITKCQRNQRFLFLFLISIIFISSLLLLSYNIPNKSLETEIHSISNSIDKNKFDFTRVEQLPVLDNPVWFIQITDVHFEVNAKPDQTKHLQYFLNTTLSIIDPAVVIVTGDLTRSVKNYGFTLAQNPQEWELYKKITSQIHEEHSNIIWLDIPGNHDNFDEEYLSHYSQHRGTRNNLSQSVVRLKYGTTDAVTFIPVDASIKPGLRAFNFFGHITEKECNDLKKRLMSTTSKDDIVILYGHYTTSTIISECNLHDVFSRSSLYLCGHLHTVYGLAKSIWNKHHTGYNELELGDWKYNHKFRIIALDEQEITWLDVDHMQWPAVLITNINIVKEKRKPVAEVRMLIFSDVEVIRVQLGSYLSSATWVLCRKVQGPIYTARIDYRRFDGFSDRLRDVLFRSFEVRLEFKNKKPIILTTESPKLGSLPPPRSLIGVLLLTTNLPHLCLSIYLFCVAVCMSLLILGRLYYKGKIGIKKYQPGKVLFVEEHFLPQKLVVALVRMTSNSVTYWLLVSLIVYPIIGPWYKGRLAGNQYGWVFFWCIWLEEHTLPGALTYREALTLVLFLQLPFLMVFLLRNSSSDMNNRDIRILNVIVSVIVLLQTPSIYAWIIYDGISMNGPLRFGLTLVALVIWFRFQSK